MGVVDSASTQRSDEHDSSLDEHDSSLSAAVSSAVSAGGVQLLRAQSCPGPLAGGATKSTGGDNVIQNGITGHASYNKGKQQPRQKQVQQQQQQQEERQRHKRYIHPSASRSTGSLVGQLTLSTRLIFAPRLPAHNTQITFDVGGANRTEEQVPAQQQQQRTLEEKEEEKMTEKTKIQAKKNKQKKEKKKTKKMNPSLDRLGSTEISATVGTRTREDTTGTREDTAVFTVVDALTKEQREEVDTALARVRAVASGKLDISMLPRARAIHVKAAVLDACVRTHNGQLISAAVLDAYRTLSPRVMAQLLQDRAVASNHLNAHLYRIHHHQYGGQGANGHSRKKIISSSSSSSNSSSSSMSSKVFNKDFVPEEWRKSSSSCSNSSGSSSSSSISSSIISSISSISSTNYGSSSSSSNSSSSRSRSRNSLKSDDEKTDKMAARFEAFRKEGTRLRELQNSIDMTSATTSDYDGFVCVSPDHFHYVDTGTECELLGQTLLATAQHLISKNTGYLGGGGGRYGGSSNTIINTQKKATSVGSGGGSSSSSDGTGLEGLIENFGLSPRAWVWSHVHAMIELGLGEAQLETMLFAPCPHAAARGAVSAALVDPIALMLTLHASTSAVIARSKNTSDNNIMSKTGGVSTTRTCSSSSSSGSSSSSNGSGTPLNTRVSANYPLAPKIIVSAATLPTAAEASAAATAAAAVIATTTTTTTTTTTSPQAAATIVTGNIAASTAATAGAEPNHLRNRLYCRLGIMEAHIARRFEGLALCGCWAAAVDTIADAESYGDLCVLSECATRVAQWHVASHAQTYSHAWTRRAEYAARIHKAILHNGGSVDGVDNKGDGRVRSGIDVPGPVATTAVAAASAAAAVASAAGMVLRDGAQGAARFTLRMGVGAFGAAIERFSSAGELAVDAVPPPVTRASDSVADNVGRVLFRLGAALKPPGRSPC